MTILRIFQSWLTPLAPRYVCFISENATDVSQSKTTETVTEAPQTAETKVETTVETAPATTTEQSTEGGESEATDQKPVENGTAEKVEGLPKLFVGRLPVGTKDAQLKELFSTYGEVTHCDIVGKYGFVVSYFAHF